MTGFLTWKGWLMLGGGLAVLAMAAALLFTVKANGALSATIKDKDRALVAASAALKRAADDIKRFAAAETETAEASADRCAVDVTTAYRRGVSVGMAVCEASQ